MAAATASLLVACGGGGTTSFVGVPASTSTISGTVGNASGAPVVGATVSATTTAGPPVTVQTDGGGNFSLQVPTASLNAGTVVVVTVSKDGHKSCTGIVDSASGSVTGCTTLPLAGLDELHPAPADAGLVRLGDGETTGGAVNSKLQIPTPNGLSKTIALTWPANFNLAAYQTFTVNVNMRGVQGAEFGCANKVVVQQGASAATAVAVSTFSAANGNLLDSDRLGAFSSYGLQLPTSLLSATGGNIFITLESGLCTLGTPSDPSDDFEFVGLFGKFS
ncbi:MAG: hypothetical protein AD742_16590 [Methylibium sp. NZG]|nr:MAG: hypothetical protein AD742_16590 [Methylibium sp. NZG]